MDRRKLFLAISLVFPLLFVAGCGAPATTPTIKPTFTSIPPTSTFIPTIAPINTVEPTLPSRLITLFYEDDGSRDGLAALLYLLSYTEISIEAASISYGEAHPELYIQHMGRVLDNFGITNIPLGAGQDMPLAGGTPFPDWLRQLSDKFWDYPLPNADNNALHCCRPHVIPVTKGDIYVTCRCHNGAWAGTGGGQESTIV